MQVERIWWDLAAQSMRHTGGIAWKAMAGIDSALWDIRGKVLNAPVWQLLGGKLRDELRVYWSHCGSVRANRAERLGVPRVETTGDLRTQSVQLTSLLVNWNVRLGLRLNGQLGARRSHFEGALPYTENAVYGSLIQQF